MKKYFFLLNLIFVVSFVEYYGQEKSEKEKIEELATKYLDSSANQERLSSEFIATESLDNAKDFSLPILKEFISTSTSNERQLLTEKEIKSMTSAELWDYMDKNFETVKKFDLNVEWKIVNTEINGSDAFVTYDVKDREQKVMKLKKENDNWKIVLSFESIF